MEYLGKPFHTSPALTGHPASAVPSPQHSRPAHSSPVAPGIDHAPFLVPSTNRLLPAAPVWGYRGTSRTCKRRSSLAPTARSATPAPPLLAVQRLGSSCRLLAPPWVSALSDAPRFQGAGRRPGPVTSGPPGPRASPPPPAHPQSPRPLAGPGLCQTLLPCPQLPCLGSPALGKNRPASVVASWARTRRSHHRSCRHHRLLGLSASAPRP